MIKRTLEKLIPIPGHRVFFRDFDPMHRDPTDTGYASTKMHSDSLPQIVDVFNDYIEEMQHYKSDIEKLKNGDHSKVDIQKIFDKLAILGKLSEEMIARITVDLEPGIIINRYQNRQTYVTMFGKTEP